MSVCFVKTPLKISKFILDPLMGTTYFIIQIIYI